MFRDFIHQNYGIYYVDAKKDLLCLKINKCLIGAGIDSYDDYFKMISCDVDGKCLSDFVSRITVNKTNFFREIDHYNFIKANFEYICKNNPNIENNKEIRVWSMACSTGQEPYTTAIVLKEMLPPTFKIKILATDISNRVLKIANAGIYTDEIEAEIEPRYLEKYFTKSQGQFKVKEEIKRLVSFRQFNLMNPFPFTGKFDIIFCRNVMIYFNLETQTQLLDKIHQYLAPGGLLIVGQSESILNKNHNFKHIKSTIYIK